MSSSRTVPPDLIIRPATAQDVPRLWEVRAATEAADPANPPPAGPPPATLSHLARTATLLAAETRDEIIGFGGRADRGGVSFLTDLFVDPAWQSSAVGSTLLGELLRGASTRRFTLASSDARAVALYTRHDMTPRWPNFDLVGDAARWREPNGDTLLLRPADPMEPVFVDWDERVGGRRRPEDLAFLRDEMGASFFWVGDGSEPVGYAAVWRDLRSSAPGETLKIGPVGGTTAAAARASALAVVAWAQQHARKVQISVPGPHPALRELLEAGFFIDYIGTFCATASVQIDPTRYIASGEDLF